MLLLCVSTPFTYLCFASQTSNPITPFTTTNDSTALVTVSSSLTQNSNTAHGPQANFSPANGTIFKVGTSVQLNANSSTPGYDTAIVNETCPITNYAWRVEYSNGTNFASFEGVNASFTASSEGEFRVILIVTSVDPHAPSNPSFVTTDTATATFYVVFNPQLTTVAVYTDRSGNGSQESSGAYGPLQMMNVFALVTYRNISIANQNVVFAMQNPNGSIILTRATMTNMTGIATAEFRLPAPDQNAPETRFGTWSITASVNVSQVTVSDCSPFVFNYLNGIEDLNIPASVHRSETFEVELTVKNSYYAVAWSKLSITVFDQANIPIGSYTLMNSQQQMQNVTIVIATITIPSWAFTGQASVYICLLSSSSSGLDIPLAPESAAQFQILS